MVKRSNVQNLFQYLYKNNYIDKIPKYYDYGQFDDISLLDLMSNMGIKFHIVKSKGINNNLVIRNNIIYLLNDKDKYEKEDLFISIDHVDKIKLKEFYNNDYCHYLKKVLYQSKVHIISLGVLRVIFAGIVAFGILMIRNIFDLAFFIKSQDGFEFYAIILFILLICLFFLEMACKKIEKIACNNLNYRKVYLNVREENKLNNFQKKLVINFFDSISFLFSTITLLIILCYIDATIAQLYLVLVATLTLYLYIGYEYRKILKFSLRILDSIIILTVFSIDFFFLSYKVINDTLSINLFLMYTLFSILIFFPYIKYLSFNNYLPNIIYKLKFNDKDKNEIMINKIISSDVLIHCLSFEYEGLKYNDINITIKQGEAVEFYGNVEKIMLSKILMKKYELYKGKIYIGNIDLKNYSKYEIASIIDYVTFLDYKNLNLLNGKDVNCYYYDEIKQLGLNGILTFDRKSEDLIVLSDDKLLNSQKVKLSILYSIIKNKRIVILDQTLNYLDDKEITIILALFCKKGISVIIFENRLIGNKYIYKYYNMNKNRRSI